MGSERRRQRRRNAKARCPFRGIGWIGLFALLAASTVAQTALLDFRIDPYASPPFAEFRFSEPPVTVETIDSESGESVLRIECPGAVNRATEADYEQRYPVSAPLRRLDIAQRTRDGTPVLLIQAALRSGWNAEIERGEDARALRLTFSQGFLEEPQEPASGLSDTATVLVAPEEGRRSPPAETGSQTARRRLGPTGTFLLVLMLVLGGFLLGWGWATFRNRGPRPEVVSPLKLQRMSEEVHQLLEGLELEAKARLDAATAQQRAFTETVQQDMARIQEELLAIADEFERATQGVLLFGEPPTTEAPSTESPTVVDSVGESDGVVQTHGASSRSGFSPEEDRRRSIQEWVSRVSEQIAVDRYAGTQAAPLAERMRDATETTAPSREPSETPERRVRPSERPSAEAYVRARQMIDEGKTPLEIARETKISLGEVELLARLGRLETAEDAEGEDV